MNNKVKRMSEIKGLASGSGILNLSNLNQLLDADLSRIEREYLSSQHANISEVLTQACELFTQDILKSVFHNEIHQLAHSASYKIRSKTSGDYEGSWVSLIESSIISISAINASKFNSKFTTNCDHVGFYGKSYAAKVIKGSGSYSVWGKRPHTFNDKIEKKEFSYRKMSGKYAEGTIFNIDGLSESLTYNSVDESTLIICATSKEIKTPVSFIFKKTGDDKALIDRVASIDSSSSRIQMIVELLKSTGDEDSLFDLADTLLSHRSYFVRWDVMRQMLKLNKLRSKPYLEKLLIDSHPEIRSLAKSTMSLY